MPAKATEVLGDRAGLDPEDDLEFGQWAAARIRRRRRDLKLAQPEIVARLAEHGIHMTVPTYSRIEGGKPEMAKGLALAVGLASALECSITYLCGLTDNPTKWTPDR